MTEQDAPLAAPTVEGRLPNLVVAGVSKAGTTSLFSYLGQHPDIGLPEVKELHYFTPARYGEPLAPLEHYTREFHDLDQRYVAEATPGYFYGGGELARVMRQTLPDVRVVVSLRDPAERCWSWYGFVKSRLRIPREMSFDDYLDRCEELHAAGTDHLVENQPWWGLGGGCYDTWLDDWADELGDRFAVVLFDDLQRDPRAVLTILCAWLGLPTDPVESMAFPVENRTRQYRSKLAQGAAVRVNRGGERFFRRHPRVKRVLRSTYFLMNQGSAETMSAAQRARLDDFYRPHLARLAPSLERLGTALPPGWTGAPDR